MSVRALGCRVDFVVMHAAGVAAADVACSRPRSLHFVALLLVDALLARGNGLNVWLCYGYLNMASWAPTAIWRNVSIFFVVLLFVFSMCVSEFIDDEYLWFSIFMNHDDDEFKMETKRKKNGKNELIWRVRNGCAKLEGSCCGGVGLYERNRSRVSPQFHIKQDILQQIL